MLPTSLLILFIVNFISLYCCYEYKTYSFKQKVDHFGYANTDYFLQRYLVADQYFNTSHGPILFYTGNEGDITMFANNTGFMWELAPVLKALLVFAEHRYYGISLPYGNKSLERPEYSGFLTSEQALADYAALLFHLKLTSPDVKYSPVIAFGGSYGGMLAAWMRIKYPHIINGALASSAPVLQFTDLTPCHIFSDIVTNDFQNERLECAKSIRRSWKIIRNFGQTERGANWLTTNFRLCNKIPVNDTNDLVNWITDTWAFLAMLDYPYHTNFLLPLPAHPIKEACSHLQNSNVADEILLINIFKAVSVFQNYSGQFKCFDLSQSSGGNLGDDAWDFQTCTEMVMPMCSDGINDMFESSSWNITTFSSECLKKFGRKPDIYKAQMMYGGRNISSSSNIIFSNGKLDPWSGGGILESISKSLTAIVIDGAAHHLDLRGSNPEDPPSVIKARKMESMIISTWIEEDKKKKNRYF